MKTTVLGIFFAGLTLTALANGEIKGKVISIVDGNTLEVKAGENETYKIVLLGVDCPELNQRYGEEAKSFLEKLALRKEVDIKIHGKDRFGNRLAVVFIKGDIDLRVELLKEGLAWTAEKNPLPELEPYKTWAQKKEKGLWKEKDPTPPWTYRRQQSMVKPKSS